MIWLHSEEQFWPSSVEFFLPAMTVNDIDQNVIQFDPTPSTILVGNETNYMHMQTKVALGITASLFSIVARVFFHS